MDMTEYDKQATIEDFTKKCEAASLTPEQTAQVIGFRFDGFWCNTDATANTVIDFFQWANDKVLGDWLEKYQAEHGDPRDTSIDVVRLRVRPDQVVLDSLNRTITTCYFGCGNAATTTRTRPDGAVKNCPTCKDCADLIDEQNYNEQQAYEHDPERVR